MNASPAATRRPEMPAGIQNVYYFEVFNTLSWSVVLGSPMLLFFQHLNASATVVAISGSLSPLLNILQIPAARYVEQVGYKKFVLRGWTSRSFLVIGMAVIAFLPEWVDLTLRIVLMLVLTFFYNVLRGISVCGMLPWFTHLVVESRRGEFLAKDQAAGAIASIASMFLYGALLRGHPTTAAFGLLFILSTLAAFCSLIFMKRIPEVEVEPSVRNQQTPPWKEMFFHPPFYRYLSYIIVMNLALGASNVFWVRFFRSDLLHITESGVLLASGFTSIIVGLGVYGVGTIIDRVGNKPVLTTACVLLILHFSGWASVAAGMLPFNQTILIIQCITAGLFGACWNLANVRMVMGIVPIMGRAHFLALYSVASNVTLGLVPLLWGPILDHLNTWTWNWPYWQWNEYSLLYFILLLIILIGVIMLQSLSEPEAMSWDVFMRELLVTTPSRALTGVLNRLRPPGGMG